MALRDCLTVLLLAAAPLLLTGCAVAGPQRSTGAVLDDASISTKVRSALLIEKDVNSFDIGVETYRGTVRLSGSVDSQWQIDKAVQVASGVGGVQSVKNELVQKNP